MATDSKRLDGTDLRIIRKDPGGDPLTGADNDTSGYLRFAVEVATEAGMIAREHFRRDVPIYEKDQTDSFDPVTRADREIEQLIRERILSRYPDHGVTGEEHGDVSGSTSYRWLIDPIDGTRAFVTGSPLWGILVGLLDSDKCVVGVMHQPILNETYYGTGEYAGCETPGGKVVLNARRTETLADAFLYCTSPDMFTTDDDEKGFAALSAACRMRRFGGDCYSYCMLAMGYIDLVVEADLAPYDIVPLIPIVEGAGGIVSDWRGGSATGGGNIIAASNAVLHKTAIDVLGRHLPPS